MASKFTKSFNRASSRFAFWHLLRMRLGEFDSLMKHRQHLTPDDVKRLRESTVRCISAIAYRKRWRSIIKQGCLSSGMSIV